MPVSAKRTPPIGKGSGAGSEYAGLRAKYRGVSGGPGEGQHASHPPQKRHLLAAKGWITLPASEERDYVMAEGDLTIRDELDELGLRLRRTGEAVRKLSLDDDQSLRALQELWREAELIRARLYELHLQTRERYLETSAIH